MGADGTTSQAWLAWTKVTSKASVAAVLSSDDSITFDVDTGAENHYIPTSEAHKLDYYSTSHTRQTVVCANNTEDPTRGCVPFKTNCLKLYDGQLSTYLVICPDPDQRP
jgi:hypothetical protein